MQSMIEGLKGLDDIAELGGARYDYLAQSLRNLTAEEIVAKTATMGLSKAHQEQCVSAFAVDKANYQTAASMGTLTASTTGATTATSGLKLAMKGLWASLKPFLGVAAVAAAIAGIAWAIDEAYVSAEEQAEKNVELKASYDELSGELEMIASRMAEIKTRMDELNALGSLSLTDQQELENLKQENKELEHRKTLLEGDTEKASAELNSGIDDWYEKEFQKGSYKYAVVNPDGEGYVDTTTGSVYDRGYLTQEEQFKKRIERAKELIALGEKRTVQDEEELRLIREATTATANELATKIDGYEAVTEEQKAQKALWESYIADAAYVKDPAKYQTERFNDAWNSKEIAGVKDQIIELAKAGEIKPQDLRKFDPFIDKILEVGLSAKTAADQINSMMLWKKSDTKPDFMESFKSLSTNSIESILGKINSGDLTANNLSFYKELQAILEETGVSADSAYTSLKEFAEGYVFTSDLNNSIRESYTVLQDVKEEFQKAGAIGSDSLSSIAEQFPGIKNLTTQFEQGWISATELIQGLEDAYAEDADAYRASMVDKLQSDADFYNTVATNNAELITGLSEAYQDDSDNWASLAEAKASIDETLIQRLSEGWSEYFGYIIDANTGLMHLTANTVPEDESADYLAAYAALNEIVTARNDLIEASKLQINLPDNFKSKKVDGNGDGGGDDSTSENEIDWIQRKNEILQRLHDEQLALADDETNSYNERIAALKELIEKDKERAEIARQSANKYSEAWEEAASKIDAKDRERIENGSLEIIDYTEAGYDDEYVKNLQKAQELYDQKVEAESNANEIEKDSEEHRRKELQLLGEIISAQQEILDNEKATLEAKIEMAEVAGKYVGAGSYKDLIENSKEMESSLRDQIDNLEEQITLVDEDSAEYNSLKASIADCEQSITECQIQQAKWNETIERLPVERIQTYITLLQHTIEDFDNFLSQQSQIGINPNKEQYQTYIDLYTDQINELLKKQEKLVEIQSKYDYGSEKYKEYADEIQGIDNEISGLIDKQLEYNDAILQIPINEMSDRYDNLAEIRATLDREIAEDNAKGLSTTIDQYGELNKLALQQLQLLVARRTALEGLLNVYDEDSDKYRETQDAINGINGEISSLVQEQYNWNQEILNMPTEKLEKINDNLSNYSSILGSVLEDYDSALAGINTLIDGQIEGIQDQLDLLSQTNEARKIQLGLEQALYNLERAKEQENIKVIRDGKVQYEADQDALRDAQQELADAQYDKMVYDLEQQIDALENIKDKWQEIIDKIQEAKDLQSAEDLFGEGWQDSVLADSQDLRDIFQNLYSSTSAQKESIDREIESNERLVSMMGEFVTRYQEGSLTYEQALAGINSTISAMGDGFSALEQLGSMMNLDNIASLGDIASSAEAGITGSAALLKDYLTIVESNKESVEGFETVWGGMSESIDEAVKVFNEAVNSMETYLDVFAANSNAINANTSNWEEMKSNIEAQVEALKAAAEALEKQANSSSGNKKPTSSSTSSRDDDDEGGVYISAGGNSYHESTGTTAEIIGAYGSEKEKSDYAEIRYNQIKEKAKKEGEGWYEAAKKALDEELEKAGIPTYHSGIANGLVKSSNSSFERFIKSIAIDPLKSDEVLAKLQSGEGVFTQPQMSNLVNNSMLMGRIYDQTTGGYKTTSGTSVDFSIGELHLHEVQNPDELANALKQSFASSMRQNFTEVFKK